MAVAPRWMGERASLFWLHPTPPPFDLWILPVPLYPMGRDRAPFFFGNVFDSGLACALRPKILNFGIMGDVVHPPSVAQTCNWLRISALSRILGCMERRVAWLEG